MRTTRKSRISGGQIAYLAAVSTVTKRNNGGSTNTENLAPQVYTEVAQPNCRNIHHYI